MPRTPLPVRVGRAIARLRKEQGYSQESFANRCKVHRNYMGQIERGELNIGLQTVEKIARALKLTPAELFLEADRK